MKKLLTIVFITLSIFANSQQSIINTLIEIKGMEVEESISYFDDRGYSIYEDDLGNYIFNLSDTTFIHVAEEDFYAFRMIYNPEYHSKLTKFLHDNYTLIYTSKDLVAYTYDRYEISYIQTKYNGTKFIILIVSDKY